MNWREYEKEIYRYFIETFPSTSIKYDQRLLGKFSKIERQIDILIEGSIAGFAFKIIVDCKYFSKKIDVKEVESFCAMVEDVDADQGVLITKVGFSKAAINRAHYGSQKVELDILNFNELKSYQGECAIPYHGHHGVNLAVPFGWVIDVKNKINGIASLYQRGITLEQAQKNKEWMYVAFGELDNKLQTLENLIDFQNRGILEFDPKSTIEDISDLNLYSKDNFKTKIRLADISKYNCLEITGFIKYKNFIFWAVMFTPKELFNKNLRKLKYLLSSCFSMEITFDNTKLINQLLGEIESPIKDIVKSNKYNQIGNLYNEMFDYPNALINYRKSILYNPRQYEYLRHIIDFEFKHGETSEAIIYSSNLLAIEPKNPTVPSWLIDIFLNNDKGLLLDIFFVDKLKEYDDDEIKGNISFHLAVLHLKMNKKDNEKKYLLMARDFFKRSMPKDHYVFKTIEEALFEIKNGV